MGPDLAPSTMTLREEAERLVALFDGHPPQLVAFLSGQLSVLKQQGQTLLGLCGLTITVTGFSGHNMVRGGVVSVTAMGVGIALILVAAVIALRVLTRLRWVSQDLADSLVDTAEAVIVRRNAQQRALAIAGGLVAAGLAAYLVAVLLAAITAGLVPPGTG